MTSTVSDAYLRSYASKVRAMHEAIGAALAQWTWVEDGLVKLTASMLGCSLDKAGIVWYSVINFNAKIEMIDNLIRLLPEDDELAPSWPSINDTVLQLAGKRNRLAHWEIVSMGGRRPFDAKSEARLVPHTFDKRRKVIKHHQTGGSSLQDVQTYAMQFNWMRLVLLDVCLARSGKIAWPDRFSRPLSCPQKLDDLLLQMRKAL